MKKSLKPVVIAAAVACIGGIGAVSFAAWTGAASQTGNVGGTTGNVAAIGFTETLTGASVTGLMPYDQGSGTRVYSVQLPDFAVNTQWRMTVKLVAPDSGTAIGDNKIMVKYGAEVTAAPSDTTGYIGVASTAKDLVTATEMTAGVTAETITGQYLTIILNSNDLGDMDKVFKLEVKVEAAA